MFAVHFENLIFILLVFVALLFQVLARAATKGRTGSDRTKGRSTSAPPPIPREPAETDEERIRKFLEALGQPASSKPPPPVKPRPTYEKPIVLQHVPPFKSPLPPLTTVPPLLPTEAEPPQPLMLPKIITPVAAETPTFEVHQRTLPAEPQPMSEVAESKAGIAIFLASPEGLRNAIILREIFGPPRSLQPLDLIGSA
jgi:hypothetical protein